MLDTIIELSKLDLVKLLMTLLLTVPIAYNREQHTKIMGLRTFPLVALATCAYVLISKSFIHPDAGDAQARVVQGILAGLGFIGGGAILKKEDKVLGTASAASIWTTGAIGIAVACVRYDIAFILAVTDFLILRWLTPLKSKVSHLDESEPAAKRVEVGETR